MTKTVKFVEAVTTSSGALREPGTLWSNSHELRFLNGRLQQKMGLPEQWRNRMARRAGGEGMKWTEPDGYSPDKDEFDQLDEERTWHGLKLLAAMLAVTVLIISGISAWRYVADCSQYPQLTVGECAAAWFYSFRT